METPKNISALLEQMKRNATATIKKGVERPALIEQIRSECEEILRQAIQELEDDWADRCPNCGAHQQYSQERTKDNPWLGLGEDEACKLCGADAIHKFKRPLTEVPLHWLVDELCDVERAYRRIVAEPEGRKNREYFRQLLDAIGSVPHDHRKDLWASKEKHDEYEKKFQYALDLLAKVDSPKFAKYYCDDGLLVSGLDELNKFIAEMELEYKVMQILA